MTDIMKACAEAREANRALNALGAYRDLVADDHEECDAAIERAVSTPPTSIAEAEAIASLALEFGDFQHFEAAMTSIRDGMRQLSTI